MDEIVKEMKKEINYGTHKYNWPKEYATRLYKHSVGNVLSFVYFKFRVNELTGTFKFD